MSEEDRGDYGDPGGAYDLTHSFRDAAELTGCSHHTVARYVWGRDVGQLQTTLVQRNQLIDPFRKYIEGWVDDSHGRVRADVVQDKLEALGLGYAGSERTIRRAVAEAKAAYRAGHRRRFRPWLPEPGLWFQWDYADGPLVEGRKTWLWCAWLAWSRFRVVLPICDKTLPTVIACIDTTLRRFSGTPTYGLSDNEKTLTLDHIARIAVRHPTMVEVGRFYGLTFASCVPADPQSKGGSEATAHRQRRPGADRRQSAARVRVDAYTDFPRLAEDATDRAFVVVMLGVRDRERELEPSELCGALAAQIQAVIADRHPCRSIVAVAQSTHTLSATSPSPASPAAALTRKPADRPTDRRNGNLKIVPTLHMSATDQDEGPAVEFDKDPLVGSSNGHASD